MKKALFVVTSHSDLGQTGKPTGWYLPEVSHPYFELAARGIEVDFASPKGGKAPMDESSRDLADRANRDFLAEPALVAKVENTLSPEQVDAAAYDAIFFAGGHGTMWDFADDAGLARITAAIYERGGVVAAVCHGPSGLVNVKLSNGAYLVDGKRVGVFTNAEESEVGLTNVVPFLLESRFRERGATVELTPNWSENVVVDGRLVTGQNPMSARKVGAEMGRLLA